MIDEPLVAPLNRSGALAANRVLHCPQRLKPPPLWGFALFLLPMALDGGTHFLSDLSRSDLMHRLRCAEGQLRAIAGMIETDADCHSVLWQLLAVQGALREGNGRLVKHQLGRVALQFAAGCARGHPALWVEDCGSGRLRTTGHCVDDLLGEFLNLALRVSGESLVKVAGASLVIAALAAVLPIKQIAGRDPALVFRGK